MSTRVDDHERQRSAREDQVGEIKNKDRLECHALIFPLYYQHGSVIALWVSLSENALILCGENDWVLEPKEGVWTEGDLSSLPS